MATQQAVVDDLLDRLAGAGRVTARKMFGEFYLYLDGKPVALVCDGTLFVKPTTAGRELVLDAAEAAPYSGAKLHLALPPGRWDDAGALCRLLRATHAALPPAKPRRKRPRP